MRRKFRILETNRKIIKNSGGIVRVFAGMILENTPCAKNVV